MLRRSLKVFFERKLVGNAQEAATRRVVRFHQRCRVKSMAGRPVKAGVVREELYDWFCLIKRSVRGRTPPAFVLQRASTLVEDYVSE